MIYRIPAPDPRYVLPCSYFRKLRTYGAEHYGHRMERSDAAPRHLYDHLDWVYGVVDSPEVSQRELNQRVATALRATLPAEADQSPAWAVADLLEHPFVPERYGAVSGYRNPFVRITLAVWERPDSRGTREEQEARWEAERVNRHMEASETAEDDG